MENNGKLKKGRLRHSLPFGKNKFYVTKKHKKMGLLVEPKR